MWLIAAIVAAGSVGTNVHLPPSDTLDLAVELGGGWVRVDFNWDIAQPTSGATDWALFDALVDAAEARGLKVYATIGYCPAWASASGDRGGDGPTNDVPDATAYKDFVQAAAERYGTRVAMWGTWNEPNLGDFFSGTRTQYIQDILVNGAHAVKAADPGASVCGP
ncbi:MAG TPA: hypothetical protein VL172_18090, partial [Kofleriaceae bacterium]|nr:hypothetical protein [Kofleriaceae bacterium]